MNKGLRFDWWQMLVKEKAFFVLLFTVIISLLFHNFWAVEPLSYPILLLPIFIWLFLVMLWGAFAVVRQAGALALALQEPLGSVILTLSVIAIEVMMITSVMLTGAENPTLARDTLFAIIMIVLNGLVGVTLVLGAWRYKEQQVNLQGARAFLSVIVLMAVIGLVIPNYTHSTSGPTLSPFLTIFLICISLCVYGVFLAIQTIRHRKYFLEVTSQKMEVLRQHSEIQYPPACHIILLILYLVLVIFLAKMIAVPIDYALNKLDAPDSLGGILVAALILAPEGMAAIRASWFNQLQHSMNILLGSVLATISLTIPAVLIVGLILGKTIILGLDPMSMVLLFLTLFMSMITFSRKKTNVLQGVIHILIFVVYMALIFD